MRPRIPRALVLLVCALAPAACAADGLRKLPERVSVPGGSLPLTVEMCGGVLFLVDAILDGEGPFRMLVDTGAEVTVLGADAARTLDDRDLNVVARGSGGKRAGIERWVRVESLTIDAFEAGGFDAAVMDLTAFTPAVGTRIDGILGYPTFAGTVVTFDYARGAIDVEVGALPEPDGETVFGVRTRTRPAVPLEIQGRITSVLFDTGQVSGLAVDRFGELECRAPAVQTGFSLGAGGRTAVRSARLDGDVRLGRFTLRDPIVRSSGKGSRIGAAVLRNFVCSFDPLNRRVRLTRDGDDVIRAPAVRGLGAGFNATSAGYEVLELYPGSPLAAHDVAPGDLITAMDGETLAALGCERFGIYEGKTELRLTVRRGLEERTFTVPILTAVE